MKNNFLCSENLPLTNSHIEINGNNCATIDGCRQIIECTEIMCCLQTLNFRIEIWGSKLKLSCFSEGSVEVRGIIGEIKIDRRNGE